MNDTRIQQSIFNFPRRGSGASKKRWLSRLERHIMEMYILTNYEVVMPYYESFLNELYEHYYSEDPIIEELVKDEINYTGNKLLKLHDWGHMAEVTTFPCYFMIGYDFHTERHSVGKSTSIVGYVSKARRIQTRTVTSMVDPVRGMKVHPRYHLVDVNFKKVYQKNEPFILTRQAVQVYYTEYPSMKRDKVDWMPVCKIKARRVVDDSCWTKEAFKDEPIPTPQVLTDDH
ncbi:UNVERIFIED_CONTAM: hypothetical protein Sradi_2379000 [Sesamum radiatum]|uniref:DUF4216 domain-containing protein n=1 Tax=Sesamum radiatum TaxID=300843 RepID=A0AAW2T7L0_SESRA